MVGRAAAVVVVGLSLVGCSGDSGSIARERVEPGVDGAGGLANTGDQEGVGIPPTRPPRKVQLLPDDVSTAVDGTTLELAIDGSQGDPSVEAIVALTTAISLRTWPEQEPWESSLLVTKVGDSRDSRAHVLVKPTEPLQARWYTLVVASLPSGFAWWNDPDSRGEKQSRFRTDSRPTVASVLFCRKGSQPTLHVRFSEPVPRALAQNVTVSGAECTVNIPVPPTPPGPAPSEPSQEPRLSSVSLTCDSVGAETAITVSLPDRTPPIGDSKAWRRIEEDCGLYVPVELD